MMERRFYTRSREAESDIRNIALETRRQVAQLGSRSFLLEAALRVLLKHGLMSEFAAQASHPPDDPRIFIEKDDAGLFYGTSPDVPGLLVAKPTEEEALADVPRAIDELEAVKQDSVEGE